jgi:hypothetical protein
MTPIDDELRTALHRRAAAVAPPADPLAGIERRAGRIHRCRVAGGATVLAVAVAALAVGLPLGLDALQRKSPSDSGYAGGGPMPSLPIPSVSAELPPVGPGGLVNFLAWPARGSADVRFENEIGRLWARQHHLSSKSTGVSRLWQSALPGGGRAGVWQFWKPGMKSGYTVVGQQLPSGKTFILRDAVTPKIVRQISAVLQGGAFPHVLVLGPPGTVQIRYAADGVRLIPAERLQGFAGGDGWAVFDRTGPAVAQQRPDLIDVVHADGFGIYHGPIDMGPSTPDV